MFQYTSLLVTLRLCVKWAFCHTVCILQKCIFVEMNNFVYLLKFSIGDMFESPVVSNKH